jgi:anaerobic selenocysteine-containing dehydrogenase
VQEALSFTDVKDALKKRVIGLYKAKRGSIVEEGGAAFLNRLYEVGTWSDQTYAHESWNEVLRTPSGRFEFFSTGQWERLRALAVAHKVELDALPSALGFAVDPDRLCLPRHEDARWSGDSGAFPLMLEPYRLSTACEGGSANLPWLHELKPYAGRAMWATEVELHPETARAGGVAEGERAVVRSALGAIEAQVHVDAGVPVGVLRIAQGGGHTACGRYARGVGANVMRLVSLDGFDPLCGASPLHGTRVALERSKA